MFKQSHTVLLFAVLFVAHQFMIIHADDGDSSMKADNPDVQVDILAFLKETINQFVFSIHKFVTYGFSQSPP